MGLEMFAYSTSETVADETDFTTKNASELHSWWKHPNLHGWMQELYYSKGGIEPTFNCVNVQLTLDDIDSLEKDVRSGQLPETGLVTDDCNDGEIDDDLDFIAKAREALEAGLTVYYTSWW